MPNFKIIDNISEIKLNNKWVDSPKFNSKDRLVDEKGQTVSSSYQGRKYHLISKKERPFSCFERIGRGFLGTLAVVASLGFALFSKSVQQLFTDSKEKTRFGVLSKEAIPKYDIDYDLNYAVSRVKNLSEELFKRMKGDVGALCITLLSTSPFTYGSCQVMHNAPTSPFSFNSCTFTLFLMAMGVQHAC